MNLYLQAFSVFFKIGAFTIGGGYAMVPLIEDEVVNQRKWIAKDDFIDLLAIAQSAPGILAVNISIFGGGYAMVPLIEDEVVNQRKWIAKDDFIDLLAIAQSAPGILAVNISIFIGYRLRGIRGSIITTLGTILPSFLIILAIALFFHNFKDNTLVEKIFKGIRPAVVALIAAPTFSMAKSAQIGPHSRTHLQHG